MPTPFLIFAQPRSRTAWLSALFTTGRVFCHHDALRLSHAPPKLSAVLRSPGLSRYVGTCDNAIAVFSESVLEEFPDAPVAVVERDPEEVCRSLEIFHRDDPLPDGSIPRLVHLTQLGLDRVKKSGRMTHHLTYGSLDSVAALGRLWRSLVPDERFDSERATAMLSFNVQIQRERYDRAITPEWAALAHAVVEGGEPCLR